MQINVDCCTARDSRLLNHVPYADAQATIKGGAYT